MNKSITIQLFIFLLNFLPIHSREKDELLFRKLSEEGLSGCEVTSVVCDEKGYIWIGTLSGLNRYDGYRNVLIRNIPSDEKSSNIRIRCLEKDSTGNLWISKDFDRLSILDLSTQRFTPVCYRSGDEAPVSVTSIRSISKNEVLVGTQQGKIYRIQYDLPAKPGDSIILHTKALKLTAQPLRNFSGITSMVPFLDGILVGCWSGGLYSIENDTKKTSLSWTQIDKSQVNSIFRDSKNCYWVGTTSGVRVWKYLPSKHTFSDITPTNLCSNNFRHNVLSIAEDDQHHFYFSTEMDGLFVYHASKNGQTEGKPVENYTRTNSTLFSNQLRGVYIDRTNMLWTGTQNDGIAVTDLSRKKFRKLNYYEENTPNNEVVISSVYEDSRKRLWVGTIGDGLYCYDLATGKRHHKDMSAFGNYRKSRFVKFYEDREGNVWFCSWGGLYYLPRKTPFSEQTALKKITDEALSLPVWSITQDENGWYWIGTENGLHKVQMQHGAITSITGYFQENVQNRLPGSPINDLIHTGKNTIWAGTTGSGLLRISYNEKNNRIAVENFSPTQKKRFFLSSKTVWAMLELNDSIWVATDDGLNLIGRNGKGQYEYKKTWSTNDGLLSNKISAMVHDNNRNLWLATSNGLSKLQTDRKTLVNYDYTQGLSSNTLTCATNRSPFINLYLGTTKGLNRFAPEKITTSRISPRTQITNLLIFNKEVNPNERINGQVVLTQTASYSRKVYLSYRNNHFTLQFSAMNFALPHANRYSYILEGYDTRWLDTYNHQNAATYTNLPTGKYLFKVKAVNSDGITDLKPAELEITIGTAPWKSGWALTFYALIVAAGFVTILRYYRHKIRLENEVLLEKHKREQEHELTEMKINFLTNISHDLRTPLTLIALPLAEINKLPMENNRLKELLHLVSINADRLMRLATQMLDFQKTEQEIPPLHVSELDIIGLLEDITLAFTPLAQHKNISLKLVTEVSTFRGFADKDILDKTISNLIHNALKFTQKNGTVTITLHAFERKSETICRIQVADTGIGFTANQREQMLEKKYPHKTEQGYGIGLSLVHKLISLHHGTLSLENKTSGGSVFTLEIPVSETAYPWETKPKMALKEREIRSGQKTWKWDKNKEVILVVEDNPELRNILTDNLSDTYRIIPAINGKEGLQKATEHLPDLIVSDIMMPEMDGISFSTAVKSDIRTSHIPFIFLTAKGSLQNQLEGLSSGAEDYIAKPFEMDILRTKIANLLQLIKTNREHQKRRFLSDPETENKLPTPNAFIEKAAQLVRDNLSDKNLDAEKLSNLLSVSRRHLYRKFKEAGLSPADFIQTIQTNHSDTASSTLTGDDLFVKKASQVVMEHLAQLDFEPEQLGTAMGMSYHQLHRKLKATVNLSASEFIRSIRLRHAAELLQTGRYRISEVMFEVGFDNASYFSKIFKQQFGKTPRGYTENHKK